MNMDKQLQLVKQAHHRIKMYQGNRKSKWFPFLILMIIVSTIIGANYLTTPSSPKLLDPPTNTQYMLAMFPHYAGVEDLATSDMVDVIAHGVITSAEVYIKGPVHEESRVTHLKTNFTFQLHRVLMGSLSSKVVQVHQSGGTLDGRTDMFKEDPFMQVGDELILFLREFKNDPGNYLVEGASQGRFVVQANMVFSIGELVVSTDESVNEAVKRMTKDFHTGGISETEFILQIQAALSTN